MLKPSPLPFHLEPHPTARSRAVTSSSLPAGTTILSTPPLATVLLESEKGKRCDLCHFSRTELHRCAGCKRYWYCDATCQMMAWRINHRHLCKHVQGFMTSQAYEHLSSSERLHSLLLAHLLAEHGGALWSAFSKQDLSSEDLLDPISTLLSLLPSENNELKIPELPLKGIQDSLVLWLSARFPNNNFTIHSLRMDVFAHGVFPAASRAFNHSCVPSAVPIYITPAESTLIRMDIKLIRDLEPGEEITITYTDPALPYSSRQSDLKLTYGFTCACTLCQRPFTQPPCPPTSSGELANFEKGIRERVQPLLFHIGASVDSAKLRNEFLPVFYPSYLPPLAEAFSNASHNGPYNVAVQKGATLLAVYYILYPANYPMIGLHALELAKTCWNAFITDSMSVSVLQDMESYLAVAAQTFALLFGSAHAIRTGEKPQDPVSEVELLLEMLRDERGRGPR